MSVFSRFQREPSPSVRLVRPGNLHWEREITCPNEECGAVYIIGPGDVTFYEHNDFSVTYSTRSSCPEPLCGRSGVPIPADEVPQQMRKLVELGRRPLPPTIGR